MDFASRGDNNNLAPRAGRRVGSCATTAGRSCAAATASSTSTSRTRCSTARSPRSSSTASRSATRRIRIRIRARIRCRSSRRRRRTSRSAPTICAIRWRRRPASGSRSSSAATSALHLDGVYSRIDDYPNRVNINTPDPRHRPASAARVGPDRPVAAVAGTFDYTALLVAAREALLRTATCTPSPTRSRSRTTAGPARTGTRRAASPTSFIPSRSRAGRHRSPPQLRGQRIGRSCRSTLQLGAVWTLRSSLPFSALAGKDLNNDGFNTDYVPGTTKNQGNRNLDLSLVNAWRGAERAGSRSPPARSTAHATTGWTSGSARRSRSASSRKLELIGQVFNLLGADNLGGVGTAQVTNALSDSFGRVLTALPRQQAELAAAHRFLIRRAALSGPPQPAGLTGLQLQQRGHCHDEA